MLHRVPTPVSATHELVEIAARVAARQGPALLFENVEEYAVPVVVNLFGTAERTALALGADRLDDLRTRVDDLLAIARGGLLGGVGGRLRALGGVAQLGRLMPRQADRPACQQIVDRDATLDALPILRRSPSAAGPSISLPLIVARDQRTGQHHLTSGRLPRQGARRLGLPRAAPGTAAGRQPVAIALGVDPGSLLAGLASVPGELDPYFLAGVARGQAVELARCVTSDLLVPAAAEIVLEGEIDHDELIVGGPVGQSDAASARPTESAAFTLTCLTRRRDPLYVATIGEQHGSDDVWLGKAVERLSLPFIRLMQPEIVDLNAPIDGALRNLLLVSIRKEYPGQAQKVIAGLFGQSPTWTTRAIVVFDADVDVQDVASCAWRVAHHVDWRRDLIVIDGPIAPLDRAAPAASVGAKIGIDATRKPDGASRPLARPVDLQSVDEIRALVDRKWPSYGIPL